MLQQYLQKLTYKIGWQGGTINYIDCFAGPWQHADEDLKDTSPFIAIEELQSARDALQTIGRPALDIRCLFIEKNRTAFRLLDERLSVKKDIDIQTLNGVFEDHIDAICKFADNRRQSFSFFFIDPTGWTGFALDTITPILRHQPGEVLINFMSGHILRFIDKPPDGGFSFKRLFGRDYRALQQQWVDLEGLDREDAVVRAYCEQVKTAGNFRFVVPSVVLNPRSDRSGFHLIYATRHIEGLRVLRNDAEHSARLQQRRTRMQSQSPAGQGTLFDQPTGRTYSDTLMDRYHTQAREHLQATMKKNRRMLFEKLEEEVLPFPFVTTKALKDWLGKMKKDGIVDFEGLGPRSRVPQADQDHYIVLS